MTKYTYGKSFLGKGLNRLAGIVLFCLGIFILAYISFPLISWQVYFVPVFASQQVVSPIPQNRIVSPTTIQSLFSEAANTLTGVDYTNAQNWFPGYKVELGKPAVESYTISIPKLSIRDAVVSTVNYDLDKHLVNYPGTGIPGENGNAVIFGHSTLPQLFNPKDYKKIFATAYSLAVGDEFSVTRSGVTYKYKIFSITVVDPSDTSVFSQNYDTSYVTLVTCTPPGTTWKRLIIKARLQAI